MKRNAILSYYEQAGWDYEAWSRSFQMHFGYWKRGIPWWNREEMLRQMNRELLSRVGLSQRKRVRVADLGCGLGSTLCEAARLEEGWELRGLSLVPWQVEQARLRSEGLGICFEQGDYSACPWEAEYLDGAWCLESACHASGEGKGDLVQDVARVLKPGARWVVVDGFTRGAAASSPLYRKLLQQVSSFWAMECFPGEEAFRHELEAAGLELLQVEDLSWRVAPSVLHVPWVTLKYFLVQLLHPRHRMNRESWRHIAACLLSPFVGLNRKRFAYQMWIIRKPEVKLS